MKKWTQVYTEKGRENRQRQEVEVETSLGFQWYCSVKLITSSSFLAFFGAILASVQDAPYMQISSHHRISLDANESLLPC